MTTPDTPERGQLVETRICLRPRDNGVEWRECGRPAKARVVLAFRYSLATTWRSREPIPMCGRCIGAAKQTTNVQVESEEPIDDA